MSKKEKQKVLKIKEVEQEDSNVKNKDATAVVALAGPVANVSVSGKTSRGICRFCDEAVFRDQARFNCVKGYFHAKCHKVLGKCYICDTDVRNSDLYAFNKRGHYHVLCIGTSVGNCRFCHENVYVSALRGSAGKRGNDGNGYFHDECQKGMVLVSVAGCSGGKAAAVGGKSAASAGDGCGKSAASAGDGGGKSAANGGSGSNAKVSELAGMDPPSYT